MRSPGGFFSEGPSVAEKCSSGPETPWIQKWPCFALVVVGRGLLGQKVVREVEGLVPGNTSAYHDRGHAAFSGPPASGMQSLSSAAGFCSATVGSSPPPDRV